MPISISEAEALKAGPASGAAGASPIAALSALLGGGARKAAPASRGVALPERDTAILNALDKLVSKTGLA